MFTSYTQELRKRKTFHTPANPQTFVKEVLANVEVFYWTNKDYKKFSLADITTEAMLDVIGNAYVRIEDLLGNAGESFTSLKNKVNDIIKYYEAQA